MRYVLAAPAAVLVAAAPVALRSEAAIPDTPAGRFISVWLKTYHSGDPKQVERYNALYGRKSTPESWAELLTMTGRITPVRIESRGPNE